MDEDLTIINTNSRNEKIKNFLKKNTKNLILISVILILVLSSFFYYKSYKEGQKELIANKYISTVIDHKNGNKSKTISKMKEIIEQRDETYSPLALYFLIDKKLIENNNSINSLFDILINKTSLENEVKNLVIYKKALFNADFVDENELLNILNPLINSESVWKSHALYLVAEYYYSKNEKQKSKEFFNEIIVLENSNKDLRLEALKRINRDLSD